jgi:hypothetical protein
MEKEVESLGKEIVKDASSSDDNVAGEKVPAKIDGKELVQLFNLMSVSKKSKLVRDPKSWRSLKGSFSLTKKSQAINRLEKSLQKNLKHRSSVRQKKKPDVRLVRVKLRPSKLTSVVAQLQKDHKNQSSTKNNKNKSPDSRFSEFSADCSKALETIEKTSIIKPQQSTTNKKKKTKTISVKPKLNFETDDDDDNVGVGHKEGEPNSSKKPNRVQKKRKASTSCAQQARNECYNTNSAEVNLSIDYLADYLEETILFPKKMSYMAELMYT